MTLPYIWYRTSVWILHCTAVNNFWGFLVIFWKVPVIVDLAACDAMLELPLGRPGSTFPSPHEGELFLNLFLSNVWLYMSYGSQNVNGFFSVHLIPFSFLFYFYPLSATLQSHTSETSAERLALACERVHADNAMHYVFTAFVWNAAAVILASL